MGCGRAPDYLQNAAFVSAFLHALASHALSLARAFKSRRQVPATTAAALRAHVR